MESRPVEHEVLVVDAFGEAEQQQVIAWLATLQEAAPLGEADPRRAGPHRWTLTGDATQVACALAGWGAEARGRVGEALRFRIAECHGALTVTPEWIGLTGRSVTLEAGMATIRRPLPFPRYAVHLPTPAAWQMAMQQRLMPPAAMPAPPPGESFDVDLLYGAAAVEAETPDVEPAPPLADVVAEEGADEGLALLGCGAQFDADDPEAFAAAIDMLQRGTRNRWRDLTRQALDETTLSHMRESAAAALGRSGDPRAIPVLVAALDDADPSVREAAAWGLGHCGDPAGARRLLARWAAGEAPCWRTPEWALGLAAPLAACGGAQAIPCLIYAWPWQDGEFGAWIAEEAAAALRAITGEAFDADHDKWRIWWEMGRGA